MNRDDFSNLKSHLEPPWDDVKEQRVLARVMSERREASRARWPLVALPAAATVLVAAAVVLFVVRRSAVHEAPPLATTAPSTSAASPGPGSVMALADGSQAVMLRDAGVQVEEQSAERVHIVQRRGAVRYEVRHDPAREFAVRAGGSTIRVRGTIFTVDLAERSVEVSVQRGRVEVDDGTRKRELSVGESLRVPSQPEPEPAPSAEVDASAEPPATVEAPHAPATAGPSGPAGPAGPAELQARADRARVHGNLDEAASALQSLVSAYPHDARVPNALFSLARVERARGREAAAARAFERCLKAAPQGPLAEDALAEAAVSWAAAGVADSARADAKTYLARHPSGTHAPRMKAILDR